VNKYRNDILPVATLLLLGSFAFVHLLALPVFADEGGQLRWIWRVIEAGEWLQPLGDGKPLEAWPMVPLVRLGFHPLGAARALYVLAGMIGAVLTYRLALRVSDRGTAFVSGALFAICPFVVYLQRLALSDMFMCVAGIWVLASTIEFIESPTGWHTRRPGLIKIFAAYAPATLLASVVLITAIIRVQRGQSPGFGLQDLIGIGKSIYYGRDGEVLRSNEARLGNLLSVAPVWIIVPEQLLQRDLEASFGRLNPDEINLRRIAEFAKPGFRARLAIYEVAPR
jgi:hypothetical protein